MQSSNSSISGSLEVNEPGEDLLHLVYASTATRHFTELDLPGIVERSRDKNAEADVTAMLLYQEGTFLHALEGKGPAVRALFTKVSADERHNKVQCLIAISVTKRLFTGQSMGFHRFADEDVEFDLDDDEWIDPTYSHDHLSWRACLGLRLLARFRTNG